MNKKNTQFLYRQNIWRLSGLIVFALSLTPMITHVHGQTSDNIKKQKELVVDDENNDLPQPKPSDPSFNIDDYAIFDDRQFLEGFILKYKDYPKEILIEMIKDENLNPFRTAAAIRIFNKTFIYEMVSREKKLIERILLKRLNRSESPFVQIELMHGLLLLDRYRYFKSMVPALIQKMNHYNRTVNAIAYEHLDHITQADNNRAREARIVFNTLRKILFLTRKRLVAYETPDQNLTYKLDLLRWSIKILGTQELKRLPKEVLHLL